MKALYIHNKYQKTSRDLLESLRLALPNIEVLDFMVARYTYMFQGTPSFRIGTETDTVWQKDIDVTLQDIEQAVAQARTLHLSVSPQDVTVGIPAIITVTAKDLDQKAAHVPDDVTIAIGDAEPLVLDASQVEVTFTDPGTYVVTATGSVSLPARMEVVVGER